MADRPPPGRRRAAPPPWALPPDHDPLRSEPPTPPGGTPPVAAAPAEKGGGARQFAVVRDVDGPRVRLGVLWFGGVMLALAGGRLALALLYAAAAALAAGQLVRPLRDGPPAPAVGTSRVDRLANVVLHPPMRLVAVLGAGSLPLAAAAGTDTLLAAATAVLVVAFVFRLTAPAQRGPVDDVGATLAAAWSMGLAAAAPVLAHRIDFTVALTLVVLVSAYDAGDFIVGTGTPRRWEGPAAGIATVAVFTFALAAPAFEPLGADGTWVLGGVVAVLAPFGPPAASVLLGSGRVRAGYVRRLDSLLVCGPIWVYAASALSG